MLGDFHEAAAIAGESGRGTVEFQGTTQGGGPGLEQLRPATQFRP